MSCFRFSHAADGRGYSVVQGFVDAAAYERWAVATMASPELLKDLQKLGGLIGDVESCLYGEREELARSPTLTKFYPNTKRVHGKPDLAQFGWAHFGWLDET